ncbi:MAG: hypothetical protein FJZ78_02595 [Bacteroidetes bacterium]|nr:hypothetical protein [Bacteroidota bacterium]
MKPIKILTAVLFLVSIVLFWFLYNGIDSVVEKRALIAAQEQQLIDRLRLIREAEIVFQEQNGRYTANWDSLADFIENGKVPIINRREEIKQKAYGGEEVILHIDTLGYISAKDRIFKKNYTMNAPEDGVFEKFQVAVGQKVVKGMKAYNMKTADRSIEPIFIENGTIESLAELMAGENVTKGSNLINFWEYQFDINTDIRKIGEIPYLPGTLLEIFVGKVDKNGLMVDVIEVKDPKPANPERKESNEVKTKKPLRFGSRLDASTVGNWE